METSLTLTLLLPCLLLNFIEQKSTAYFSCLFLCWQVPKHKQRWSCRNSNHCCADRCQLIILNSKLLGMDYSHMTSSILFSFFEFDLICITSVVLTESFKELWQIELHFFRVCLHSLYVCIQSYHMKFAYFSSYVTLQASFHQFCLLLCECLLVLSQILCRRISSFDAFVVDARWFDLWCSARQRSFQSLMISAIRASAGLL